MGTHDDTWVLGINAYDHDVAACLLQNGEVRVAVAKERITRVKHDMGYYKEPIDYCLKAAGIPLSRVDLIVRNSYVLPVREIEERLVHHHQPGYLSLSERELALPERELALSERDRASPERTPARGSELFLGEPPRVVTCSHHLAHAYSAFAVSPFEEGAVMVVDGVGSYRRDVLETLPEGDDARPLAREAESYYRFESGELETIEKVWMDAVPGFLSDEFYVMPGLGALYSRVSTYIFGHWNRCGEVMGLAPYGELPPDPLAWLEDGRLVVPDWGADKKHPFLGRKDGAWTKSPHLAEWKAMARRVQEDTEQILIERARRLHAATGAKHLCIAGGVALNCVANGRIVEETPFEEVYIQPAAGDDGIAIGCALYGHLALRQGKRPAPMRTAYLGREYSKEEVAQAVRPRAVAVAAKRRTLQDVARETAALLAAGKIVGWFQGRSEFGPRALGNRSILADPRDPKMKDRVNTQVKHRQSFRPFAPVVMFERAHEIFEGEHESPFMLLVKRVRPEARDRVPSIVHVDGTARVQTLRREANPRLYALLEAFDELTGVPVLLNTSFNDRGEPIVETPEDAVTCFLGTKLDALVLHDVLLEKRHLHGPLFPLFRRFARIRRGLSSSRYLEQAVESLQSS